MTTNPFVLFLKTPVDYIARGDLTKSDILDLVRGETDVYRNYFDNRSSFPNMEYCEVDTEFCRITRRVHNLYSPYLSTEIVMDGMVEVEVVNKRKERTGKRTLMKIGKYLTTAYPFLTDKNKESIVTELKNRYLLIDVEFTIATTNFGDIVSMPNAKSSYMITTMRRKSLADSCMRYDKNDLGFDTYHPYDAYCSGEFGLAYAHKDGKLYGRVLVHFPTMTYSAIYGVSDKVVDFLEEKVKELGHTPVSSDGDSWVGAKLLHLYDTYNTYDDDIEDLGVILTPYIDFLDREEGYSDGVHIYINSKPKTNMREVDLQDASGYNEL